MIISFTSGRLVEDCDVFCFELFDRPRIIMFFGIRSALNLNSFDVSVTRWLLITIIVPQECYIEWNHICQRPKKMAIDFAGKQYLETTSETSVVSVVSCCISSLS